MKLLHTADLHLGKRLNEISLLEDQAGMLEELRRLARRTGADALVIAGDIYDKSVPPAEAVELFSDFVSSLAADGVMLYAVAGNHDSGERLAFAHRLLARQGVHFAGQYDGQIMAVCQRDEYGPVNFYLLPFLKPGRVKRWFSQVESYEDAVRAVLEAARVDFSGRNVLVAHQFVTAGGMQPERSESETEPVAVGGAYSLDVSALEGFDYVALGHIHRAQAMGRPAVRYAGSPLKYSFSEARHDKSVMLVELKEKGCVEMTALPLAPKRDMLVVEGPLEALLAAGEPSDSFVRAILTDEGPVLDAAARLKTVYPNLLRIDFPAGPLQAQGDLAADAQAVEQLSPQELLEDFFIAVQGRPMSRQQRELARKALEGGERDAAQ